MRAHDFRAAVQNEVREVVRGQPEVDRDDRWRQFAEPRNSPRGSPACWGRCTPRGRHQSRRAIAAPTTIGRCARQTSRKSGAPTVDDRFAIGVELARPAQKVHRRERNFHWAIIQVQRRVEHGRGAAPDEPRHPARIGARGPERVENVGVRLRAQVDGMDLVARDAGRSNLIDVGGGKVQPKRSPVLVREPARDVSARSIRRCGSSPSARSRLRSSRRRCWAPKRPSGLADRDRNSRVITSMAARTTPAAVPRQPACTAATAPVRESAISMGTQSATCTASTSPGSSETSASALGTASVAAAPDSPLPEHANGVAMNLLDPHDLVQPWHQAMPRHESTAPRGLSTGATPVAGS